MAPYQAALSHAAGKVRDAGRAVGSLDSLARERDRLADDVAALQTETQHLAPWRARTPSCAACCACAPPCRAPRRLRGHRARRRFGLVAKTQPEQGHHRRPAGESAGRDPGGARRQDVPTVSSHTCDVLLLGDPNCRVAVRLPRTGGFAILRGGGPSRREDQAFDLLCPLEPSWAEYLKKDLPVQAGDVVVTSDLGGTYPPGLPVGTVTRVATNATGLYLEAAVAPAADLSRLRQVLVLVVPDTGRNRPRPRNWATTMTALNMTFLLLAAGVLQSLLPAFAWLGSAKPPILLAVALYYAVLHERPAMVAAALLAGVIQDSLSLLPMGYSALAFTLLGWLAHQSRQVVFRESLVTAGLLGAVGGMASTLLLCLMLVLGGDYVVGSVFWVIRKIIGAGLLGLLTMPLVWRGATALDRLVGVLEPEQQQTWPSGKRQLLS